MSQPEIKLGMLVKKELKDPVRIVFGIVVGESAEKPEIYEVRWITSRYGEHGEQNEHGEWCTLEKVGDLIPYSRKTKLFKGLLYTSLG